MVKGTVKWYNPEKGFGFIKPDDEDKDIFVIYWTFNKSNGLAINWETPPHKPPIKYLFDIFNLFS